jgi:tripartite-type tricarboxylate transporter receptor subunit TctC
MMAGIQMTHVPYRGAAPSLVALSSNEVQIVLDTVSTSKPLADAGRARGIAAASAGRSPAWPELPTVRESGLPGYEVNIWHGIFAPAATPAPIVEKLNAELRAVMAADGMQAWANQLGFRIVTSSPVDFRAFFLAQVAHWEGIVKQTGVQLE